MIFILYDINANLLDELRFDLLFLPSHQTSVHVSFVLSVPPDQIQV